MARKVRDASLESKASRASLKARGKPYYRALSPGLHLGYRKPRKGVGKWVARHYAGARRYQLEIIGVADDVADADGVAILSFGQAQSRAHQAMTARTRGESSSAPIKVRDSIERYIQFLTNNRKSALDAQYAADAFILPELGDLEVEKLRTDRLRKWLEGVAQSPAKIRTKPGQPQRYRKADPQDPEWERRRRSSANRILTVLKAALNRDWRDGRISSDAAWRRVEPFEGVDIGRHGYLDVQQAQRLVNGCDIDFGKLVRGGLETGARYSELAAMRVRDFNRDSGTIAVWLSKGRKSRHIVLSVAGIAFFQSVTAGRAPTELIFRKRDGTQWREGHQARPMAESCLRAGIGHFTFHGLRHTWASLSIMNGAPLIVVAKNLGHSDTRTVEKHYGHLANSYVAQTIRASAPVYGLPEGNVVAI